MTKEVNVWWARLVSIRQHEIYGIHVARVNGLNIVALFINTKEFHAGLYVRHQPLVVCSHFDCTLVFQVEILCMQHEIFVHERGKKYSYMIVLATIILQLVCSNRRTIMITSMFLQVELEGIYIY